MKICHKFNPLVALELKKIFCSAPDVFTRGQCQDFLVSSLFKQALFACEISDQFLCSIIASLSPEQGHPAAGDIRPKNLRDDFQEYNEGRLRRPWVYWGWRHSVLGCSSMRARQGHCTKATLLMSEGPQVFGWEERRNSHFLKTYYILVVWLISYNPHDIPMRWRSLFSRHKWRN